MDLDFELGDAPPVGVGLQSGERQLGAHRGGQGGAVEPAGRIGHPAQREPPTGRPVPALDPRQEGGVQAEALEPGAQARARVGELALRVGDLAAQLRGGHLALGAALPHLALEHLAGAHDVDDVLVEAHHAVGPGLGGFGRLLMQFPVAQREDRGLAVRRVPEVARAGDDQGGGGPVLELQDGHTGHPVGPGVEAVHQEPNPREVAVEDPLPEPDRGPLAADVRQQVGVGVVGLGQHEGVEVGQPQAEPQGRGQGGEEDAEDVDAAGLEGDDLGILAHPAEGDEGGDQDPARHGQGGHPPETEEKELADRPEGHAPLDPEVQIVHQEVHLQRPGDHPEAQEPGNQRLAQDVQP